jgi:hypothetical protein
VAAGHSQPRPRPDWPPSPAARETVGRTKTKAEFATTAEQQQNPDESTGLGEYAWDAGVGVAAGAEGFAKSLGKLTNDVAGSVRLAVRGRLRVREQDQDQDLARRPHERHDAVRPRLRAGGRTGGPPRCRSRRDQQARSDAGRRCSRGLRGLQREAREAEQPRSAVPLPQEPRHRLPVQQARRQLGRGPDEERPRRSSASVPPSNRSCTPCVGSSRRPWRCTERQGSVRQGRCRDRGRPR